MKSSKNKSKKKSKKSARGGNNDGTPPEARGCQTKMEWCSDHRGLMHLVEMRRDLDATDDAPDCLKWKLSDSTMQIVGGTCEERIIVKVGNDLMAIPRTLVAMAVLQQAFPEEAILASLFCAGTWNDNGSTEVFFVVPNSFHAKITESKLLEAIAKLTEETGDMAKLVHSARLLDVLAVNDERPGELFQGAYEAELLEKFVDAIRRPDMSPERSGGDWARASEREIVESVRRALCTMSTHNQSSVFAVPGDNTTYFDIDFLQKARYLPS